MMATAQGLVPRPQPQPRPHHLKPSSALNGLIMPVSSIPPEILSQIFIDYLPTNDGDRLDPKQAPALLCTISSSWRSVALSEPCLWDTLILPAADPDPTKSKSTSPCVKGLTPKPLTPKRVRYFVDREGIGLWFGRAGPTRLLTLGEDFNNDAHLPHSSYTSKISEVVEEYGPGRFKYLSLVCIGLH
jgi:hypothetical protein